MQSNRTTRSGFTLVEILIVVIILGILAAIVIPQFTNASQDARKSSLTSQLQTLRSQVELFKLQHRDNFPTGADNANAGVVTGTWNWNKLTQKTDQDGKVDPAGEFGPYLQAQPVNPICNDSTISSTMFYSASELAFQGAISTPAGWVVTPSGKVFAGSKTGGFVYDEGDPNAAKNDQ